MNLYRLDFVAPDGSVREPVSDALGRDFLTPVSSRAREYGMAEAGRTGGIVRCTRIAGGGHMTTMWHASGETNRIHREKRS